MVVFIFNLSVRNWKRKIDFCEKTDQPLSQFWTQMYNRETTKNFHRKCSKWAQNMSTDTERHGESDSGRIGAKYRRISL